MSEQTTPRRWTLSTEPMGWLQLDELASDADCRSEGDSIIVREDRATEADIEAVAKALLSHDKGFESAWDDYAGAFVREHYRKQARAALAAVFSEVADA